MPVATRKNNIFKYILSTDFDEAAEKQPWFEFRVVCVAEWLQLADISDRFFDDNLPTKERYKLCHEIIIRVLTGWGNMILPDGNVIDFDLTKLDEIVAGKEKVELMMAAMGQRASQKEKVSEHV